MSDQSLFKFTMSPDRVEIGSNLSKLEYACIALKVPCTGIAEIDAVIREANRMEDARAAMTGFCANPNVSGTNDDHAAVAFSLADAMAQARGVK